MIGGQLLLPGIAWFMNAGVTQPIMGPITSAWLAVSSLARCRLRSCCVSALQPWARRR